MRGPFYNKLFTKLINIDEKFSTIYIIWVTNLKVWITELSLKQENEQFGWRVSYGALWFQSSVSKLLNQHTADVLVVGITQVKNHQQWGTPPKLKDKDVRVAVTETLCRFIVIVLT